MKKLILTLLFLLTLTACEERKPEYVNVTLLEKKGAIGSEYNNFYKGYEVKTNYYFVFSDGTVEKVNVSKYLLHEKGDHFRKIKRETDNEY